MAKLTLVYWRDIPSQVIVKKGRDSAKVLLSCRFQETIDRAAMRARKVDSDAYMEDWRREAETVEGQDLQAIADAKAEEIEKRFSDDLLDTIARNKGYTPNED